MKINNINIEDDSYRVYPIPPIGQSKNDLKKRNNSDISKKNKSEQPKFEDVLKSSMESKKR